MPHTLEELQHALDGRYRIDRELGRGGMAIVYLAHDLHHDRPVALKVLLPELAAALGVERFQREIRLAARLQHPHILGVHDSGEDAGRLWFTMPFVEGESLRDRLNRERQLPIVDAVRFAREASLALDYAHRHGVIHRDVKPENILLSDDQALVADFGIARALRGEQSLTATGVAIGTPTYMSPEQASGEREVDGRTDIYALGCVLYEMLAGEPPFTGPNTQAIIARALTETPRPLSAARAAVPPSLATVVMQAIARTPADRFPSAAELARALGAAVTDTAARGASVVPAAASGRPRRASALVVAAAVLLAAVGGAVFWSRTRTDDGQAKRIAVLPFENEGGAEDAYFADGVADEVRTKLAGVPGLQVTARSSANQYRTRSGKSLRDIGRELEVQYLLTGTVRWSRGGGHSRVRVNPELIEVANEATRHMDPVEKELSDVFSVQTDIASNVAQSLDVALGADVRQRLAERPTTNIEAWDSYLKGEQLTQSMGVVDAATLRKALPHYERAVALDSTFAEAWSRIARSRIEFSRVNPTVEGVALAKYASERALNLAPNRAAGRMAMGEYLRVLERDYTGAAEQYRLGIKAEPDNTELLEGIAGTERTVGKFDDALAHLQRARTLNPRAVSTRRLLTFALMDANHFPEALVAAKEALAIAPQNISVIQSTSMAWALIGELDSARAVAAGALARGVDSTALLARYALIQEQMWLLPPAVLPKLATLTPAAFDNNRAQWGLKIGATWKLLGDPRRAKAYADSSVMAIEAQLRGFPDDAQLHELRGRALALAGRKKEAVDEAELSLRLRETSLNATTGPYVRFQVARILIQSGEYGGAMDLLEKLIDQHGADLSRALLHLDPSFAPLKGYPRFERLVGTAA